MVVGFSMVGGERRGGGGEEDVPLIFFAECFMSNLFSRQRKR